MRAPRFLISRTQCSDCQGPTLLVLSRRRGFVSRDCLKCKRSHHVREIDLPDLGCEKCGGDLAPRMIGNDYGYTYGKCGADWHLPSHVPDWQDIFPYWGLGAPGDPCFPR